VKALVVRLSSIGDVVHTLPALAALQRHGWEAGWVVEPPSRVLLDGNPAVAQVIEAATAKAFSWRAALRTARELRRARYDAALDFQGLWKSAAWARLSGARRVLGWDRRARREPASALLLTQAVGGSAAGHVIDKNLALLRGLGIDAVGSREFPLPAAADSVERVERGLGAIARDRVAILNPGGGWPSKLWPPERFGALAQGLAKLGLQSLVTYGPGEQPLADRVVAASEGTAQRSFPTSLLDFVELARRARVVVAADTGPMHLACAVGTPVVALFGPTDPARNGPFSRDDVVLRKAPPCAPCYSRACTRHAGVMAQIGVAEVADAVARRVALGREQRAHAV
jgi:heptosyltransferase-1